MKIVAVIPARGGSKGLPDKNIKPLNGRPLIGWTIEKANNCSILDEVIVSTDSPKIAAIAKAEGGKVPFLRPAELASDTASSVDVVIHALDYYKTKTGIEADIVILLEPTSPLREPGDIAAIVQNLIEGWSKLDGVVSIGEASSHPALVKKTEGSMVGPYMDAIASECRRQELPKAYFPYGVGYAVKTEFLRLYKSFYPKRCGFYIIKRHQCYEIDDIYDFLCIESIMQYENGKRSC